MSQVNMNDKQVDSLVLEKLSLHQDWIIVDKEFFLDLLKHSLSLNVTEKQRVIDSVPTLTQFQFDELTKVFLEERQKFRDLAKEHTDDIKKLVEKQKNEWIELWERYGIADTSEQMAKDDQAKIDDIQSQLWL